MDASARALVERLALAEHPEGGWYRETWRDRSGDDRGHASLILFLLAAGEESHWHRIDADEIWLFHAGAPLMLSMATGKGAPVAHVRLSAEAPQAIVPAQVWQSAASEGAWTLAGCVVAPAFDFAGFALAPQDWAP
jgi:predicted cupin superfamily sugar epimerase